jgi:hypothetical protein
LTWKSEERLGDGAAVGEPAGEPAGEAATTGADGADEVDGGSDFVQPDSAMRSIAMISGGLRGTG